MAAEIAEPQDLPSGSITPETEDYFKILVYQQAQDNAGIKQLGLGEWKNYLGFNSHKVNNVANYVGIDTFEDNKIIIHAVPADYNKPLEEEIKDGE